MKPRALIGSMWILATCGGESERSGEVVPDLTDDVVETVEADTVGEGDTNDDASDDASVGDAREVGDALDDTTTDTFVPPPLPAGVFRFDGTDIALSFDDLAPIADMIDGAELVGLGEAVHTSGGFYAAKRRLIRYLVEARGFRVLAMETPRTAAEQTARYVEACSGTSRQALSGIFGVFADFNTHRMLEDLCDWNRAHPDDPVRFYGFDVQQPEYDREALGGFLGEHAPDLAESLLAPIDEACMLTYVATGVPSERYQRCMAALDAVDALFDERASQWQESLGEDGVAIARLTPLGLRAWQEQAQYSEANPSRSYQVRDDAMARVLMTLRRWRYPEPTIVWAHDMHLNERALEWVSESGRVWDSVGSQLAREYGDDYQPLAISALRMGINWPGVGCGTVFPIQAGSLEARLLDLGAADYLVDLALASGGAEPFVSADEAIPYGLDGSAILPQQFRGVVVLRESPPMRAAFWPDCE